MNPRFQPTSDQVTPYLFFTGKGGVGKTSTACATAVALANEGKRVLIVSTDPASNLQDVFEQPIEYNETVLKDIPGVTAINLDPEEAAAAYREKMVGPYRDKLPATVVAQMEEQMSGACTVEIAAFDEFATLLTNRERTAQYDHIIFDTAPTGHTLRLLQLPTAWSGFLDESTHGASCLGPLSGLADKKELYSEAVEALSNHTLTTLILVTRPDESALSEAARASTELREIGLENQCLIINGKLQKFVADDPTSVAFYNRQEQALELLPDELKKLKTYELPFVPYQLTGVHSLTTLFAAEQMIDTKAEFFEKLGDTETIREMIEHAGAKKSGVILTMGKGGVGKTTMAAIIAVGLAEMGHTVHLTTTDPAEHLSSLFNHSVIENHLSISRINPKVEVEHYKKEVLEQAREHLDENGLAYLEEDLSSPCTEEIAVFRAFAKVVEEANDAFVVIDTAPTGHTLLLLDAAESYHKELERSTGDIPASVSNLLPRLRNPAETDVFIVTLPEATPVHEAERLQVDLNRAGIEPTAWIVNQSFSATKTTDPILKARAQGEGRWLSLVQSKLAKKTILVPWRHDFSVGYQHLKTFI
ncbi:arsenical pump-driving ATPase [Halalkalibacter urbisdiaboli]|uniref:arsenical pump-driving ATPase n=1 Tax=Halalkalibacter urbisdiaboli TaxID=1960589 RepID=UPI000B43BFB4|nr:arsenical pump-driving ATPase [Halalkalibacter urbisdiaboli]